MKELLLRTGGPALVLVIEVEGPTRLVSTATASADRDRLDAWVEDSAARSAAVAAALADRGGARREREWVRALAADGGGIVEQVENLLAELHAAETRAEPHAGVGGRLTRRLRPFLRRG